MASKLIQTASHEAENPIEVSLREAFELLEPQLRPPFPFTIPTPSEYLNLNRAILYGILYEPHLARVHIKHLHGKTTDGYSFFMNTLTKVVNDLYPKLFDSAKVQLIWVTTEMVCVSAIGIDGLLVAFLRQIVAGDFGEGNLWLCSKLVCLFLAKWDCLLEEESLVLTSALYTFLRVLADHYGLSSNSKLEVLKQMEIDFCVRMLREQFHLCFKIGRDLVRLLQDLVHVPAFRAIWKDLLFNPGAFKTNEFCDISQLYLSRTSSQYFVLRVTPEMETQLRFLLTHVKLGSQKRYQDWFARKFLCFPERETLVIDIVRFICCSYHPPNEIIQSAVIPRWAVIGWLLKSCRKNYVEANVKLALFYDWLFFDDRLDSIMNVEPAILLMVNSLPKYLDMTHTLLEFLQPVESRKLAGLILKNALDAKEQHRKFELVQRWLSLDPSVKAQIKASLLKTLSSPVHDARSTASQVIAKIAAIELPHKQWPELIGALLSNIHQHPAHTKQATLETLGYLCEEVSPEAIEQDHVNKILTAVVQGMNASEANNDARLAATRALYNALGFAQANFSNDMERDYIMRVVCEGTLSPEVKIRQAAFECLVAISSTYYDKLAPYIHDIFNLTAKAVKEDEEAVALQAIEFWSSICDEEIDILEEYGSEFSGDSDIPCFYFIKKALPVLVPMLLETLLKQEEDQDQDEGAWNIAMAGGTCLGLVARTVGDDIVPLVMPFIEENLTKPDWRQREAATYAFGSILEGPSPGKVVPLVNVALNFMLSAMMKDPNNHVKDTTAWTLGRMFEFLHGSTLETPIITQANIQQIITVLLQSMKDVPNVAEKACGALYFLAQGYEDIGSPTSPLTPFFQDIIQALLAVTHREDAGESRLRTAAYETLNEVVRCSTDETAPMVMQLVPLIMMELHQTLEAQKLSSDEREKQNELQGLLCGCLQVIIQKLGSSEPTKYVFMQYADQMMNLFLRVFACRSATAHEEAMLAIGALAYAMGSDFTKYLPEFYKYLEMGLQNFEDYQVCAITVGVVGDICRAIEDKMLPYCDGIMTQLLKDLSSNQLHRSVKPPIFSCFGDIALAIGENFEKYLMYAMPMLQSAAELSVHTSGADDDIIEYTNLLRNGILEAYSGIFQGFKGSPKTQLLMPYSPHVLQFLDSLYMEKDMDDIVSKTAIGVLGDLADTLGSNAGPLIQQSVSSKDFLNECLSSEDHLIKESAEWAKLAISRAISF